MEGDIHRYEAPEGSGARRLGRDPLVNQTQLSSFLRPRVRMRWTTGGVVSVPPSNQKSRRGQTSDLQSKHLADDATGERAHGGGGWQPEAQVSGHNVDQIDKSELKQIGLNKFGIPAEIESAIRARDVECVYCPKRRWFRRRPRPIAPIGRQSSISITCPRSSSPEEVLRASSGVPGPLSSLSNQSRLDRRPPNGRLRSRPR